MATGTYEKIDDVTICEKKNRKSYFHIWKCRLYFSICLSYFSVIIFFYLFLSPLLLCFHMFLSPLSLFFHKFLSSLIFFICSCHYYYYFTCSCRIFSYVPVVSIFFPHMVTSSIFSYVSVAIIIIFHVFLSCFPHMFLFSGHLPGSIFSRDGDMANTQNLLISFKPIICKLNYSHVINHI
jgi:hypothetical protein